MKIGVTSKSNIKIGAVKNTYGTMPDVDIIGYTSRSSVGEQPVENEVLSGARNRIHHLKCDLTSLDLIVSIENGLFKDHKRWVDKAVVIIYDPTLQQECYAYSEAVEFPTEFVEQARAIGFATMTVAKYMQERGHIKNHQDPHSCLSGTPRQTYLEHTIHKIRKEIEYKKEHPR